MNYNAITLNGNTDIYFGNELLYRCVSYKYLLKDIFYIEDIYGVKLLELEIKHFFGFNKKYLIIAQKLNQQIYLFKLKKKLYLKVENDIISINKKIRAWKFEGDFIVNNEFIGDFNNDLKVFKSSFTFDFNSKSDINIYCIILFSILIIDEFNTRPTT